MPVLKYVYMIYIIYIIYCVYIYICKSVIKIKYCLECDRFQTQTFFWKTISKTELHFGEQQKCPTQRHKISWGPDRQGQKCIMDTVCLQQWDWICLMLQIWFSFNMISFDDLKFIQYLSAACHKKKTSYLFLHVFPIIFSKNRNTSEPALLLCDPTLPQILWGRPPRKHQSPGSTALASPGITAATRTLRHSSP